MTARSNPCADNNHHQETTMTDRHTTNTTQPAALTPEREAEYRTAELLATKGPWGLYDDGTGRFDIAADLTDTGCGYRCRREIAQLDNEPMDNDPAHKDWTADEDDEQVRADAAFIGLAREAVPVLLAELDRVRAERDEARARVAELEQQAAEVRAPATSDDDGLCQSEYSGDDGMHAGQLCTLPAGHRGAHQCNAAIAGTPYRRTLAWI